VPLASLSNEWKFLPQHIVETAPTKLPSASPPVWCTCRPRIRLPVTGIEIEGFNWAGLDVQYPWEDAPRRGHHHLLTMKPFYIDRYPVTNAGFKKFLDAAQYHPQDDHNFLKTGATNLSGRWANKPVTWVSLEDARLMPLGRQAIAARVGMQYAAQGTDGRLYPWGNSWDERAVAAPYKGRDLPGPADVDAHPAAPVPSGDGHDRQHMAMDRRVRG